MYDSCVLHMQTSLQYPQNGVHNEMVVILDYINLISQNKI